jgi:hypothetical protein
VRSLCNSHRIGVILESSCLVPEFSVGNPHIFRPGGSLNLPSPVRSPLPLPVLSPDVVISALRGRPGAVTRQNDRPNCSGTDRERRISGTIARCEMYKLDDLFQRCEGSKSWPCETSNLKSLSVSSSIIKARGRTTRKSCLSSESGGARAPVLVRLCASTNLVVGSPSRAGSRIAPQHF